jgi:hypothetical protein
MCFVRISEQTATFALQNIKRLVFITEVESVYSAVRTESLYKTDMLRLSRVNADSMSGFGITLYTCIVLTKAAYSSKICRT